MMAPFQTILKEPKAGKIKSAAPKAGTGFGAAGMKVSGPLHTRGVKLSNAVHKDGCVLISNALSPDLADTLRAHILEQQDIALANSESDPASRSTYYGLEPGRKNRYDLLLSLMRGGYEADTCKDHPVADALQELLGSSGSMRAMFEQLCTDNGLLYEMAATITYPGSARQMVHPDLPFQDEAPLYVVFLALQDITEDMGPTTFFLGSQTKKTRVKFDDRRTRDELLRAPHCLATLKKGDAVCFDARVLHCGGANDELLGSCRVLFNFSFRNPKAPGDMGYPASVRPRYEAVMSLSDISDSLTEYKEGNPDPFSRYGNGADFVQIE